MSLTNEFTKGIIRENPLFRLVLGTCPSLAITTSVDNGLGMGVAFTAVLLGSNIVISAMRNIIPESVRIPVYVVIIAAFVTMIDLLMHAFTPALYKALGMGVGFTLALVMVSTVREVLGAGTFYGINILPENVPAIMMILPPGGFITLGCLLGLLNKLQKKAA